MKIVLATYGSRGDVQPMLALSLALKARGHDVRLAASPGKWPGRVITSISNGASTAIAKQWGSRPLGMFGGI